MITAGLAFGAVLAAILTTGAILDITASAGNQSPIAGDPATYDVITTAIFDGGVPYIDVTVEHLPGALVPMLLIEALSRMTSLDFEGLWALTMGLVFLVTVIMVDRVPIGSHPGLLFLGLSLPLLPLILFRNEPWLMAWVVASLLFAFRGSWLGNATATVIASLTKGWPIILLGLPFRLGRRRLAVITGLATFAALVFVTLLPGFQQGRAFEGIHSETVVGSLLLVFRAVTGAEAGIFSSAGAAYAASGQWSVLVNALIGLPFIAVAALRALRSESIHVLVPAMGLGVLGIILASPLFSPQFMYWLVPFLLFLGYVRRWTFVLASLMTLVSIIVWAPTEAGWALLVLTRNIVLLALASAWTMDVLKEWTGGPAGRSPQTSENVA